MIIGITGSSGAGKSTVCNILKEKYDFKIINADEIAKRLAKKGSNYLAEIVQKFGPEILLENGELNRKKLADIIYREEKKRKALNDSTFQYIGEEIKKEIKKSRENIADTVAEKISTKANNVKLDKTQEHTKMNIAIDAPLLLEAKLEKLCDTTIAVVAENVEMQIERIMQRDQIQRNHAVARMKAQHENAFYLKRCQYVIKNDGKIEDIEEQIAQILEIE